MKYHAKSKQFTVNATDLNIASDCLFHALRSIRKASNLTLDRYKQDGCLTHADHAQKGVLDAAEMLGIDMGAKWGHELDLRTLEE